MKDNLKDKLRAVPIEVNVELKQSGRRKRQTALAELSPVLAANKPIHTEVNTFCITTCKSFHILRSLIKGHFKMHDDDD